MKKKKIFSLMMASALCLSALTGCGSAPADSASADNTQSSAQSSESQPAASSQASSEAQGGGGKQYEGVELTMWSMWTSSEPQAQVIQEAAAAFEEQTGAKIKIEWKGRDINNVLSASLEAGDKFDIFEDDYQRIANVYA